MVYRDIIEVDGIKYVHPPTPPFIIARLGQDRFDLVGNTNISYDFFGRNIAKEYNFFSARAWCDQFLIHWYIPVIAVSLYMFLIFAGQKYMSSRKRFEIRTLLIFWNLFLSIFSFFGVVVTLPHLFGLLYYKGLEYTVCAPGEGKFDYGLIGLCNVLFALSKFPELVDTAFIVLRKSKLIFLHWYHHVTVLLFCWNSVATRSSNTFFFIVMNYFVHSIMYFYYFLAAQRYRPWWAPFVTFIQISQMGCGLFVCLITYYYWSQGKSCDVPRDNYIYASVMYLSYFCLFVHFAVNKYCCGKSKATNKSNKKRKVKKKSSKKNK